MTRMGHQMRCPILAFPRANQNKPLCRCENSWS
nr:MAG TPA: hypothetical protein [Caudoviricetes sp.]